jgi:hypothetical protein
MITVIVNVTVKTDSLREYKSIASQLTEESRKRPGCITYIFNQSIDNPREFALYEQWASQAHLDLHINALIALLGPPSTGGLLPEKLMNMYEKAQPIFYDAIE